MQTPCSVNKHRYWSSDGKTCPKFYNIASKSMLNTGGMKSHFGEKKQQNV